MKNKMATTSAVVDVWKRHEERRRTEHSGEEHVSPPPTADRVCPTRVWQVKWMCQWKAQVIFLLTYVMFCVVSNSTTHYLSWCAYWSFDHFDVIDCWSMIHPDDWGSKVPVSAVFGPYWADMCVRVLHANESKLRIRVFFLGKRRRRLVRTPPRNHRIRGFACQILKEIN